MLKIRDSKAMLIRSPRSMRIKGTHVRNPLSINKDLPADVEDEIQAEKRKTPVISSDVEDVPPEKFIGIKPMEVKFVNKRTQNK